MAVFYFLLSLMSNINSIGTEQELKLYPYIEEFIEPADRDWETNQS